MSIEIAEAKDSSEIMELYKRVVDAVNKSSIKLGWNTDVYPDEAFVDDAIEASEMFVVKDGGKIIAAAVVNESVNDEYSQVDWDIKDEDAKIATIHALATDPEYRGHSVSDMFLSDIETYCKDHGYKAIHLDVIDTNIPGYRLYMRNGYREIECIDMYYEVVGNRKFAMMEKVLK